MRKNIERFNAKYAGSYLGDSWVVRASDYEDLEKQLEQAEARVAELESQQQLAKGTLLCPKWAKAQVLRKQAEAVASLISMEHYALWYNREFVRVADIETEAQRLRQQANEIEKGGSDA